VEAGFTTGYRGLSYHPSPQREVALARGR